MPSTSVQTRARPVTTDPLHPNTRGGAVVACYAGILLAVALGALLDRVVATPVAAVVFVVLALGVVVWLHPVFVRAWLARRPRR